MSKRLAISPTDSVCDLALGFVNSTGIPTLSVDCGRRFKTGVLIGAALASDVLPHLRRILQSQMGIKLKEKETKSVYRTRGYSNLLARSVRGAWISIFPHCILLFGSHLACQPNPALSLEGLQVIP